MLCSVCAMRDSSSLQPKSRVRCWRIRAALESSTSYHMVSLTCHGNLDKDWWLIRTISLRNLSVWGCWDDYGLRVQVVTLPPLLAGSVILSGTSLSFLCVT